MKKSMSLLVIAAFLAGCSNGAKKVIKTMTCTLVSDQINIHIDYEYDGDHVLRQIQKTSIIADTESNFKLMKDAIESLKLTEKTKGMKGVKYEYLPDKEAKKITENITLDFEKVSPEDYKIVAGNAQTEEQKGDRVMLSLEKTRKAAADSGMSCAN